jgi:hypothetical protein
MFSNSLNCFTEAQSRQQEMLRRAEHERTVNRLLRLRKQANTGKRSFIARLWRSGTSQRKGKSVAGREHVYASPSQNQ